jgi:uncharacterized protein with HEPN domain
MRRAAEQIQHYTSAVAFAEYAQNEMMRLAIERLFEIIGEALARLHKVAPAIAAEITDYQKIIDFRCMDTTLSATRSFGMRFKCACPHSRLRWTAC